MFGCSRAQRYRRPNSRCLESEEKGSAICRYKPPLTVSTGVNRVRHCEKCGVANTPEHDTYAKRPFWSEKTEKHSENHKKNVSERSRKPSRTRSIQILVQGGFQIAEQRRSSAGDCQQRFSTRLSLRRVAIAPCRAMVEAVCQTCGF